MSQNYTVSGLAILGVALVVLLARRPSTIDIRRELGGTEMHAAQDGIAEAAEISKEIEDTLRECDKLRAEVEAQKSQASQGIVDIPISNSWFSTDVNIHALGELYGNIDTAPLVVAFFRAEIRDKYRNILKHLHLDTAKEEALVTLLAEDRAARVENSILSQRSGVSGMGPALREVDADFNAKLEKLLEPEKLKQLKSYTNVPFIAEEVSTIAALAETSGVPLSDDQFTQLFELRQHESNERNKRGSSPATLRREALQTATTFLSPAQIQILQDQYQSDVARGLAIREMRTIRQ